MKNLKARCINTKEVILTDGLNKEEAISLVALASRHDVEVSVSLSGKVLIFKCDTLDEVFDILSSHGLIEYIGNLREIIDWKLFYEDSTNPTKIFKFKPKEG